MILKDEVFPIGQIGKPHGLKGELAFESSSSILQDVDVPFIVLEPDGIFVPFYIESVRMKTASTGLIKLERINSEEQARNFIGHTIYLPNLYRKELDDSELDADYFIGFALEDKQKGYVGKVSAVNDSTMNILFVVENEDSELLIPMAEEFVTEIDHERRIIRLNLPEGLLDL